MGDSWLYEDMTLLHDILPTGDEALWLSPIAPELLGSAVQKHGHPRARRVILPSASETSFAWLTTVKPRKLKSRFMSALRQMVEFTRPGEMLIMSIHGHGDSEYGYEGAIEVGHRWLGRICYLQPQDVLGVIQSCAGRTTLIVNSCFASYWVECALSRGLDSGRVTIVAGGAREEIYSHSMSGSAKFRGGYFLNCLVARLYKEYALFFPRPMVFQGEPAKYEAPFTSSNVDIVRLSNPVRVTQSTLQTVMEDICHDMALLRGQSSTPQVFGGSSEADALRFFGVAAGAELPINITRTSPENPNQEFLGHAATGCLGLPKRSSTAELVSQYLLLPFSPNAGCNTRLSMAIVTWEKGKLSWLQVRLLRRALEKRLHAFRSMTKELDKRGVKISKRMPLTTEELYFWRREAECFTVYENGRSWTQVRDLFICSMVQHQAENPDA